MQKYIQFRGATYRLVESAWPWSRKGIQTKVERSGTLHGFPFLVVHAAGEQTKGNKIDQWFGYVGVGKNHPFYGIDAEERVDPTSLGLPAADGEQSVVYDILGASYSDEGEPNGMPPQKPGVWWFGFRNETSLMKNPTADGVMKSVEQLAKELEQFQKTARPANK